MRITQIDIKNFRAFYGEHVIKLHNDGKNLLVYGENGSGKSSLYFALKYFLDSYIQGRDIKTYRNIFVQDSDSAYLRMSLREKPKKSLRTFEWSETQNDTDDVLILDMAKSSGFIDYKRLLETYFLRLEAERVNLFDLMIKNLLVSSEFTDSRSVGEAWASLEALIPERNTQRAVSDIEKQVTQFNSQLAFKVAELKAKVVELLKYFDFQLDIEFSTPAVVYERDTKHLGGQELYLVTTFYGKDIGAHHTFLNEAKLTAIALAIYLASLLMSPTSYLKILVLDDVLIGLDMSNRLPVIDILKDYFKDYQVFFLTYDRAWFEMMRLRTDESTWTCIELFSGMASDREMPVFGPWRDNLESAQKHLENHDLKAAVVYIRTALETILKKYCDGKIPVRYQTSPATYNMEHFWQGIRESKKVPEADLEDAKTYLKFLLNPLAHAQEVNPCRKEIEDAIAAVRRLQGKLNPSS